VAASSRGADYGVPRKNLLAPIEGHWFLKTTVAAVRI